jgi:HEAT repeat protein
MGAASPRARPEETAVSGPLIVRTSVALLVAALLGVTALAADPPAEPTAFGQPLRFWVGRLKDDDPLAREEALAVLADLGPAAKDAAPAVAGLLDDAHAPVRVRAALALWQIDRRADAALAVLTDQLSSPNRAVRLDALAALGRMGAAAGPAVPALLDAAANGPGEAQPLARRALEQVGAAGAAHLVKALDHKDAAVRRLACELLARSPEPTREALAGLRRRLADDDLRTRLRAAESLWWLTGETDDVVPALLKLAAGDDPAGRRGAVGILANVRPRPAAAADAFAAALKEGGDPVTRLQVAEALWDLHHKPEEVVPALAAVLREDAAWVPGAYPLLARIGPDAKEAAPALLDVVKRAHGPVQDVGLLEALTRVGPGALADVLALATARDGPAGPHQSAIQALGRGGPEAAEAMAGLLDTGDSATRVMACQVLAQIGPAAKAAVPRLGDAVKGKDAAVRLAAIEALVQIGPDAADGAAALLDVLPGADRGLRQRLLGALGEIRPDPKKVTPTLTGLLKDPDPVTRGQAAAALWQVERSGKEVLSVLLDLLKDPKNGAPNLALDALSRMGDDAREAVPAMAEQLRSGQQGVNFLAVSALGRMGPTARPVAGKVAALLKGAGPGEASAVCEALRSIGGDAADVVPALAGFLKDQPNNTSRGWVIDLLARYGPDARDAVPVLLDGLQTPGSTPRWLYARALAAIDPAKAGPALPLLHELVATHSGGLELYVVLWRIDPDDPTRPLQALRAALRDPSSEPGRADAARCLGLVGPAAKEAVPGLRLALRDPAPTVRVAAALALWQVTRSAEESLSVLIDGTKAGEVVHRMGAAQALGELGGDGKDALPALREAARASDGSLRRYARDAIRKIDPGKAP